MLLPRQRVQVIDNPLRVGDELGNQLRIQLVVLDLLVVVRRNRVLAELVVLLNCHQVLAFGDPRALILRVK